MSIYRTADRQWQKPTGGGHPQGVPLRDGYGVIYTRGEGTHKGCPYEMGDDMIYTWGRAPQGVPLRG